MTAGTDIASGGALTANHLCVAAESGGVTASGGVSLLVRGVLYTAITRARRLLILAGDDAVLAQMAANNKQQRRYSGLRRRLKEGYHEQ